MSLEMLEARASVMMELIVDKLSLLDYENKFCNSRKPPWPRLHKFYFAMQCSSQNDQFLYFVSLVSWLLSLVACKLPGLREQMDSNATCTDIMLRLKELGFAQPSWAASKLKQGFGDAVCSVLDGLTDLALEAQRFQFYQPIYSREMSSDDDVEILSLHGDSAKEVCVLPESKQIVNDRNIMDKHGNSPGACPENLDRGNAGRHYYEESKMQAERLACQSRVTMGSDGKDWRTHLNEAQQLHCDLSEGLSTCCAQLQKIEEDISFCLDKLESKERFLTKQFELLLTDYNSVKDRLVDVQQKLDQSLGNLTSYKNQLACTLEQLEKVKHMLVEKGNKISDVSPLVEMKNGILNLKMELQEMEVHVGVLEHTLLK
ncbi:hypothetical protein GOP47_0008352, partial [Adiantum capillus-veneris]